MNNLTQDLKNYFRPITNLLLTACMILGIGIMGVQAQNGAPDPEPAWYFFKVNDVKTNEITLAPGENFTLQVGFTLIGPCDGATATLRWSPDELVVPGTQVTNLIGSLLPYGLYNTITQEDGFLSFTQAQLGSYILPEPDGDGGFVETDYMLMELQVNVPEDATWASAEIYHETEDLVFESLLTFYGNSLATDESMPTFTVYNSAAAVDCEDLGLNIGDACDDGDDNTENDMVNEDCECVGEPIAAEYCTPEGTNDGRYIDNFSTSAGSQNITNEASGFSDGGYGDFTAMIVEQGVGGSVNFSANVMGGTAGFRIWVDWNQDGEFDTTEEVAYQSSGYSSSHSGSFAVPADAMQGATRMRVVSHWLSTSGDVDPCATGFTYGEFEDYTFNVTNEIAYDCPDIEANYGDACDDGNPNTIGEVIGEDCLCGGGIEIASNDEACDATALACGDSLSQSLIGATSSLDDACFGSGSADVWFSFTTDGSQIVNVAETSSLDAVVQLFTGDDCDNLVEAGACQDGPENYTVTEAGTYYFRVRPYYSSSDEGNITVNLTCTDYDCPEEQANFGDACDDMDPATINDVIGEDCECAGELPAEGSVCESALPLDCNAEPMTYSSSASNGTNTTSCSMGDNGLWFSFMGTGGDITINSTASFDHEMSINTGECDALENVGCKDSSTGAETYTISGSVEGEMYYVYVARYNSGSTITGDITIDIDCATPPVCTAPELMVSAQDADGNAIEDCLEAGGEYYVLAMLSGGSGNDNYNVFANGGDTLVAAADGSVVLGPFAVGTDADVTAVGAEDDDCEVSASIDSPAICAPSNDACADAAILACNQPMNGTTVGATTSDLGSPSCATGTPADVFYTFDVVEGAEYTVSVNGDDYDGVLVIYSGPCDDLTELACADNGFSAGIEESITWTAANTETVVIRTYDWSSSQGSFVISATCGDVTVDCPDLGLNIGDVCTNADGMTGIVDENCNCFVESTFDCPDLEANFGDACELADGSEGILNTDCECVPAPECENFTYYLADHAAADGISDIYEVTLSGGMASMEYIATSEIEVHIAFNATDNLIYAISKHENSYRTLNPLSGVWGPTVSLGADYGEITAAVFAPGDLGVPNGKLLFGSQDQNAIYSLNISTNVVSPYDSYSPVTGGDLAFTSDGMLYMSTRSGNGLYEVYPAPTSDVLIGNVPIKVTGLAATDGDNLLLSAQGQTSLNLYNTAGALVSSYTLDLDGEPYTLRDGDMASGCNTGEQVSDCDNYVTFYVNHGPDVDGSDLYTVDFVGGNAVLTYVTNVDFEAHIGYNPEESKMYFVNKDGSIIRIYNVATDMFEGDLPILGGIDQLTAVVYDSNDGVLYAGDANSDVIASIDLGSGIAAFYANAPVFGGDLAILDGTMYLARRSLSELYEVVPFGNAILKGGIPDGVNGMAPSPNAGNLVTSSASQNAFVEISATDGSTIASHPAMLDGEPFTFINGDMASGCIDDIDEPTPPSSPFQSELQSELTAFPNPTSGPSTVVFITAETGRTLVEVYDMSGRNVATLFNQEAQQGEEYRLDFDGAALPNGVYIYRMTTQNETIIEKFMIAR